jgi:RHH-type proline utilization regulon transcriptional repressor/proline dehydrogenase/delta 1-pyrroline-5-carboxylate dehydrogenase
VAEREGPILPILVGEDVDPVRLLEEFSVSTNTAAAGGNASLMTLD